MDTTFYEDSRFRAKEDIRIMKRPMTLDLDCEKSSKKPRVNSLLTSPDLNMLKLGSPELERLIIAQHGLVTITPTLNQCMYPKSDEREQYNREFADALSGLHHQTTGNSNGINGSMYTHHQTQQQSIQPDVNNVVAVSNAACNIMPPSTIPCSTSMGGDSYCYQPQMTMVTSNCNPMVSSSDGNMNGNCYAPVSNGYFGMPPAVTIKEEPQTVPCMGSSPPQSPIDMEDQERMKLERKRLRNRIAASKCRRRKLERIARLEDKVSLLKNENSDLTSHVTRLRDQVCQLKQQVMDHVRSGCEILVSTYPSYPEDL